MTRYFLWDVFLSHSSRDKPRVLRLAERLHDAGLRVWLDDWEIQPGDDIYAAIEHGLDYARVLVLCLSRAALRSDWAKLERNAAIFRDPQNKERRFIPLLLEDCEPPATIRCLSHVDWRDEDRGNLERLVELCRPRARRVRGKPHRQTEGVTLPTGAMSSDHPLYVRREADAYTSAAARHKAETIIIKAPRQMGKSSLLVSYLAACRAAGKRTVHIDLASMLTDDEMADYPAFLTVLAQEIWEQLGQATQAAPCALRSQRDMIKYLDRTLLCATAGAVVIAFDETDRVLGRPYQSDFFSMLRFWHEQRADPSSNWAKLGLALVISTEPYLFIDDVMRSPFNVGLNVALRPFNEAECRRLSRLYGVQLRKAELDQLMELLNGHPHLTHLALDALTGPHRTDFPGLLRRAIDRDGPFGAHLRALEYRLLDEVGQRLLTAMSRLVKDGKTLSRDDFYRLHGAGLVREEGARVAPTNQLYARFFCES